MTPDDLDAIGRLALGSDRWQSELARRLGVNDRTMRRWAAGENPVPAGIEPELLALAAGALLARIVALLESGMLPTEIALAVYRSDAELHALTGDRWSAATHREIMERLKIRLGGRRINAIIGEIDAAGYYAWLSGAPNTTSNRALYAAGASHKGIRPPGVSP